MESIDNHGDTMKEALRVQQVIEAEEQLEAEAKEELGEQGLVSALHDIISAITNNQDKLTDAVTAGHDKVSLAVEVYDNNNKNWTKQGHNHPNEVIIVKLLRMPEQGRLDMLQT